MKQRFAVALAALVAVLGLSIASPLPASAHGAWPDASSTGPTNTQTSTVGDQVFTSACGTYPGTPCLHVIDRTNVNGKVYASNGNYVVITDSVLTGDDSDDVALETGADGFIQANRLLITGDYDTAALYGRNITLYYSEVYNLTGSGAIPLQASDVRYNYFHDLNTDVSGINFGIQLFDVWQGCQTVSPPQGCGSNGVAQNVRGNFVQGDGNIWSALWAAPAFGTNSGASWYVQSNFFVGGASEVVHVEDSANDVGWIAYTGNHHMTGSSYTINNYDATNCNEWDNYSTASYMASPYGAVPSPGGC